MIKIESRNAGYVGFKDGTAAFTKYIWKVFGNVPDAKVLLYTSNGIGDASKIIKMGYSLRGSRGGNFVYDKKLKADIFSGTHIDIAEFLEVSRGSVENAANGRSKTCKGYIIHKGSADLEKKLNIPKTKKSTGKKKPVVVYYEGKVKYLCDSVTEAAEKTGISRPRVSACLNKTQPQANGYKFKYYGN